EDGIRDFHVTGVQTCALPISAYPLDGGRILRAFISRSIDLSSATRRAVSISTAIAMVLILAGLFSDSWLTMVGVIIFSAAQLERSEERRVGKEFMWRGVQGGS